MLDSLRKQIERGQYRTALEQVDDLLQRGSEEIPQLLLLRSQVLFQLTQFDDALRQLDRIETEYTDQLSDMLKFRINAERIEIYRKMGQPETAHQYRDQCIQLLPQLQISVDHKPLDLAYFYFYSGNLGIFEGILDQALTDLQQALDIANQHDDRYTISNCYNNLGIIYYDRGELEQALRYFQQAHDIREAMGNQLFLAQTVNNLGIIYDDWGKLQQALEFYEQSLKIYLDLEINLHIASAYNNIAAIMRIKGELDHALDYFQRSYQLFKQVGNDHFIGITLHNIGGIYFDLDQLEEAKSYLKRAIQLRERIGNDYFIAESYFLLLRVYLNLQDKEQIALVSSTLQQLSRNSSNNRIRLLCQLGQALIFKAVPSSKSRVQAQIILEDLIDDEIIDHRLSALALIHMADLLLDELRLFRQDSVLLQINDIAARLYAIGQDQYNIKLIVQVLVLLSRIRVIESKINEAENLLNQALFLAQENSLEFLTKEIEVEIKDLQHTITRYQELLHDTDIVQRLDRLEIDRYIDLIRQNLDR